MAANEAHQRVRFLRAQAEWCIEMATSAGTARMFEKYIELASAYQQQAFEIERQLDLALNPIPLKPPYPAAVLAGTGGSKA